LTAAHNAIVAISRIVRHQAYVKALNDTFYFLAALVVAVVATLIHKIWVACRNPGGLETGRAH
jgi:hypothetical protein